MFLPCCSLNCVVSRDLSAGQEEGGGAVGDTAHPIPYKSIQKLWLECFLSFYRGISFNKPIVQWKKKTKKGKKEVESEGASEGERKMEKKMPT